VRNQTKEWREKAQDCRRMADASRTDKDKFKWQRLTEYWTRKADGAGLQEISKFFKPASK